MRYPLDSAVYLVSSMGKNTIDEIRPALVYIAFSLNLGATDAGHLSLGVRVVLNGRDYFLNNKSIDASRNKLSGSEDGMKVIDVIDEYVANRA